MIVTDLDFEKPGKQYGYLRVPYSHNLGGWANVFLPVFVIGNGAGPTVLVLGGNHGDEYQGQVAIAKLGRAIRTEEVHGRLILVPSLNLPAARAGTRLSPIDGANLNRSFPGKPEGTVTEVIADYLTRVLFRMSDVVIDIHSGGRSVMFYPCSHMHLVPDPAQRRAMLEAMLAWNTDFSMLYTDIAGSGLLPVEAERQGKIVVTTELGGSEFISAAVHRIAQEGLRNVLVHLRVLEGKKRTREEAGKKPTRLVQALKTEDYILAPESGIFEGLVDLGSEVTVGEPVGLIHFLERPDRPPEVIEARSDGILIAVRAPCLTQQGDCVAVVAEEVDPQKIRDGSRA